MKTNNGYNVNSFINCIDSYKRVDESKVWSKCPCCGLKPKIWTFNNGRKTACGCWNSMYDLFSVRAESILSYEKSHDSLEFYDFDLLRKNWNEYCATMINPCSQDDLTKEGKW